METAPNAAGFVTDITDRLELALGSTDISDADAAAVELARTYARLIDIDPTVATIAGPKLLATLESLLMTPKARASVVRGGSGEPARSNPLDDLRARRAARSARSA